MALPNGWRGFVMAFLDDWDGEPDDKAALIELLDGIATLEQRAHHAETAAAEHCQEALDLRAALGTLADEYEKDAAFVRANYWMWEGIGDTQAQEKMAGALEEHAADIRAALRTKTGGK